MKTLMLACLLSRQDPSRLIEDLSSESIETRGKARESLLTLGTSARPALRKAAEGKDVDLRLQALALLEELDRRDRRRPVWTAGTRIDLDLQGVPMEAALKALFRGYVGESVVEERVFASSEDRARRITLKISQAPFWDAFDAVGREARVGPVFDVLASGRYCPFIEPGPGPATVSRNMAHDVKVFLHALPPPAGAERVELGLGIALPPGCFPLSASLAEAELTDVEGRRIEAKLQAWVGPPDLLTTDRAAGLPCVVYLLKIAVHKPALIAAGRISVKGKLTLGIPKDAERTDVDFRKERPPVSRKLGGLTLTLEAAEYTAREGWKESVRWTGEKDASEAPFFTWMEDESGARRLMSCRIQGGSDAKGARHSKGTEPAGGIAKWVIVRCVGEDSLIIPLIIDNMPVQPLLGR